MPSSKSTSDLDLLATAANFIKKDFINEKEDKEWVGSPFIWIKRFRSGPKGRLGMRARGQGERRTEQYFGEKADWRLVNR
jgi:hypothetical protein